MTVLVIVAVVALVALVGCWMEWSQDRTRRKMLRAVARIKHDHKTRSRRGSGSAQPGQPILLPGSEETARGLASASSAPSHPADTSATPRLCVRRAQTLVGAATTRTPHAQPHCAHQAPTPAEG